MYANPLLEPGSEEFFRDWAESISTYRPGYKPTKSEIASEIKQVKELYAMGCKPDYPPRLAYDSTGEVFDIID